jgi:hypothetical protein
MLLTATPPQDAAPPDWFGLGLVLAIVGGFLLANSILFGNARTLVEERFGLGGRRLASIRELLFRRMQVHLGFLLLLGGFGLQLYGHYRPPVSRPGAPEFPLAWAGAILLALVALEIGGWWLSHRLFRRTVRRFFLEHPPDLDADMRLTRELGELFGIPSDADDTVEAYVERLRRRIGLPRTSPGPRQGTSPAALVREEELV